MRLAKMIVNLCTAWLVMTATGAAENQSPNRRDTSDKQKRTSVQKDRTEPDATREQGELPKFLSELDLTAEQKKEVQEVMQTHDEKLNEVWNQFHSLHWNAIEFEATLAAANVLTGHDHSAHHESDASVDGDKKESDDLEPRLKSKTAGAANRDRKSTTDRTSSASNDDRSEENGSDYVADDEPGSELEIVGLQIAVLDPNGAVRQIRLAGNSKRSHSDCEVCSSHSRQVDAVWKRLYQLHAQLVKIEAERMVAIESKLNDDQLKKLEDTVAAEEEQIRNENRRSEKATPSAAKDRDERKE